jgi:hypothetical protein
MESEFAGSNESPGQRLVSPRRHTRRVLVISLPYRHVASLTPREDPMRTPWIPLSVIVMAFVLGVGTPVDGEGVGNAVRNLLIFGKLATPELTGHEFRLSITNVGTADVEFEVHTFDTFGIEQAFGSNCGTFVNDVFTRGTLSAHQSCAAVFLNSGEERPDSFHVEILILNGDQADLRAVLVADQNLVVDAR